MPVCEGLVDGSECGQSTSRQENSHGLNRQLCICGELQDGAVLNAVFVEEEQDLLLVLGREAKVERAVPDAAASDEDSVN